MLSNKVKIIFFYLLLSILLFWSCMDPYKVDISNSENLLVVEALITDENKSHVVKISRSISDFGDVYSSEENATVIIVCNDGTEEVLAEKSPGFYVTDSSKFKAIVGNSYKLRIKTKNGEAYESSDCKMLPPTAIDHVYYERKEITNVNDEQIEGIQFYVDGKAEPGSYIRWLYDEVWKFAIPYPQYAIFVDKEEGDGKELVSITPKNVYCWKKSESHEITVQSLQNQSSALINNKKVCFIPTGINDRFNIKYSINVKQLSISREEYNYLHKLKESTEDVDDLFGSHPYSVKGNIKNIANANEPVLGYFQMGSVTSERVFISWKDAMDLGIQNVIVLESCPTDTIYTDEGSFKDLYSIYEHYVINGDLVLHDLEMLPTGLILTEPKCADCRLTGSPKRPEFWED